MGASELLHALLSLSVWWIILFVFKRLGILLCCISVRLVDIYLISLESINSFSLRLYTCFCLTKIYVNYLFLVLANDYL